MCVELRQGLWKEARSRADMALGVRHMCSVTEAAVVRCDWFNFGEGRPDFTAHVLYPKDMTRTQPPSIGPAEQQEEVDQLPGARMYVVSIMPWYRNSVFRLDDAYRHVFISRYFVARYFVTLPSVNVLLSAGNFDSPTSVLNAIVSHSAYFSSDNLGKVSTPQPLKTTTPSTTHHNVRQFTTITTPQRIIHSLARITTARLYASCPGNPVTPQPNTVRTALPLVKVTCMPSTMRQNNRFLLSFFCFQYVITVIISPLSPELSWKSAHDLPPRHSWAHDCRRWGQHVTWASTTKL